MRRSESMDQLVEHRIVGHWGSQLGSQMVITQDEGGRLVGTFSSPVGGEEGEHPLTGFYQSAPEHATAAIGFVVRWRQTPSVTVWAGHYDEGTDTIEATWLLTGPAFGQAEWHSTNIGHDMFRRMPVGDDARLLHVESEDL
jgi:avidin family protein